MHVAQIMTSGLIGLVSLELALCYVRGIPGAEAPARVQMLLAGEAVACLVALVAKVRRRLVSLQKRQAASLASAIRSGAL